jgi:hypothetical protein
MPDNARSLISCPIIAVGKDVEWAWVQEELGARRTYHFVEIFTKTKKTEEQPQLLIKKME